MERIFKECFMYVAKILNYQVLEKLEICISCTQKYSRKYSFNTPYIDRKQTPGGQQSCKTDTVGL